MNKLRASKVTISLPEELLAFADQLAKENETTRSAVIAGLLKKEEASRIEREMMEGYKEMADENRRMAEENVSLVGEVLSKYTDWDEPENG